MHGSTIIPRASLEIDRDAALPRFVLAFVALLFVARLVSIFVTGFCDDEAYVVTIQRAPALSYFDHPPLHQWMLTAFVRLVGEGRVDRLPFLALNLATSFALFGLARRLLSSAAGWWTVFLFNACAYFLVLPDGYIMPDQPLLAFLALGAWAVAEILYGPPDRDGRLWAAAGVAFGLAGLSKYPAAFAPLGLLGFFLTAPQQRWRLADRRLWLGAALGLACFMPALIWNAEHGWISFSFQSARAARVWALNARALGDIAAGLVAQIGSLTPWIIWPVAMGLWRGVHGGEKERLLLWLAAPTLVFFALLPLVGQRAIGHWFNSGWLFAFPLAGAWLADRSAVFRERYAAIVGALAVLDIAVFIVAVNFGSADFMGLPDPTRHNADYPAGPLREVFKRSGARFALIEDWRVGGRLGQALGPSVPICAMGVDPRGFAFSCDARELLGQDGFVARVKGNGRNADEAQFFKNEESIGEIPLTRPGPHARALTLSVGRELSVAPPLPYGP